MYHSYDYVVRWVRVSRRICRSCYIIAGATVPDNNALFPFLYQKVKGGFFFRKAVAMHIHCSRPLALWST